MASKDYLYPDITPQTLKLIEIMRLTYKEHPDYFEHSPYPDEVEKHFKSWFQTPVKERTVEENTENDDLMGENRYDALYREAVELFRGLKAAKPSNADASEAMAYFRTITGLMDKLVSHQERALGIKQVHQFHQVVMEIMDNVLNEHQRDDAMKRLKDAIQSN